MGIAGANGIFKRACEETMAVLREKADDILMLLEVLLYDPLFTWYICSDDPVSSDSSGTYVEDSQMTGKVNGTFLLG